MIWRRSHESPEAITFTKLAHAVARIGQPRRAATHGEPPRAALTYGRKSLRRFGAGNGGGHAAAAFEI